MDKYKVKVNPRALRELDHIYEYIANEKLAPENAKGQVDRIKKSILSLVLHCVNSGEFSTRSLRQYSVVVSQRCHRASILRLVLTNIRH